MNSTLIYIPSVGTIGENKNLQVYKTCGMPKFSFLSRFFYATRCGLKKQFRNCFCHAARHDNMCECVCVLKPHVESSFSSPLGYRAALSNANNAVVIVVFTSIKSWQLFLPALPKKAASFTAASTSATAASTAPTAAPLCSFYCHYADSYS